MPPSSEASATGAGDGRGGQVLADMVRDISRGDERADEDSLQKRVEAWFVQAGVPQFIESYSPARALPLIVGVLLIVGAFGMSVLPFIGGLSLWQKVAAPAVVILLMLPLLPLLQLAYSGTGGWRPERRWLPSVLLRLVYLALIAFLVLRGPKSLRLLEWIDFIASVGILLSLGLLVSALRSKRRNSLSEKRCLRATKFLLVLIWIVFFATMIDWGDFPFSLWMILPVAVLFCLSIRSRRALGAADSPSLDDKSVWRQALLITLSPAMVILWVQVVVLPYLRPSEPEPLWRAVTITPFLLLVVAAGVVTITRRIWPNRGRRIGALSGTIALGLFTVLGYPLVVYLFHIDDSSRARMQDALLALAINALYLALAFVVASLGAHSVAAWASLEPGQTLKHSLKLLVHGTSLLLVLLVFFGITADVWQVAVASSIWRFLAVIGLIWLLTMFLLAYRSETVIEEGRKFNSWEEVEHVALDVEQDAGGRRPQDAPLLHELFRDVEPAQEDDLSVPLNRRARMNAMTVMLVYQGFRLFVVGISMTLFFAALGYLAVPDSLAQEWSLNGLMSPDGRVLVNRPFYDFAWVRIAALLGVISSLFIVLHVMRDPNEREAFFKDVEVAVRRRLAIRLAYLRSLRQQPATSSAEASDGGTAQPQEAVVTAPASQTGQP